MRLFVALTPPAAVVEELQAQVAPLRELAPNLRWSRPQQWHLTLAFLGEVGDAAREDVAGRLERAAGRHPPLHLSFAGSGRFGNRVLWTGIRGDREALRRLAGSVFAAARRAHLPVEDRPYRPHLTLARATGTPDLCPLVERLAPFVGQEWVAGELHLVRSRLAAGPGGTARHEAIASWPLGAGSGRASVGAGSVPAVAGIARLSLMALDCQEPRALAEFYGAITGWEIDEGCDWVQLRSEGGVTLAFQRAPGHRPPVWPSDDRPQQAHLDFDVSDLDVAEEQVLALGARKTEIQPGTSFRVYLDPAGHPFCLVLDEGAA